MVELASVMDILSNTSLQRAAFIFGEKVHAAFVFMNLMDAPHQVRDKDFSSSYHREQDTYSKFIARLTRYQGRMAGGHLRTC